MIKPIIWLDTSEGDIYSPDYFYKIIFIISMSCIICSIKYKLKYE